MAARVVAVALGVAALVGLGGAAEREAAATKGLVSIAPHAWGWISPDDRSSNSALFVGDSVALVVDPGLTQAGAEAFLAAARTVTDRPIRFAILTHWHPDHALGTTCWAGRPFVVVSHPATGRALAEQAGSVAKALAGTARTGAEREAFTTCRPTAPDSLVEFRQWFDLGGRRVEVVHPGPAHTAGDLIVWEPSERVLVTGDIFMDSASPDMGEAFPLEWAGLLDSLVALRPGGVVAGHFGPSKPDDLVRFRDYLVGLVGRVRTLLASGVPPDSVPARIRMPEFADIAQYPQFNATFAGNAKQVVAELAPEQGCVGHPVAVQILGSGGPWINRDRGSTSYLVWIGAQSKILVDAGGGAFLRFGQAQAKLSDLSLVALSHFHPDHVSDLPALLWLSNTTRKEPLPIVGPSGNDVVAGLPTFLSRLFDPKDGAFQVLGTTLGGPLVGGPGGGVRLDVDLVDVDKREPSTVFNHDGVTVTALGIPHGTIPTLAYRVQTGNRSIVFSSDQNGTSPGFVEFARGADVLVMHLAVAAGAGTPLHASPAVVGRVAQAAGVKRLIVGHIGLFDLDAAIAELKQFYSGPLTVGADVQCTQAP